MLLPPMPNAQCPMPNARTSSYLPAYSAIALSAGSISALCFSHKSSKTKGSSPISQKSCIASQGRLEGWRSTATKDLQSSKAWRNFSFDDLYIGIDWGECESWDCARKVDCKNCKRDALFSGLPDGPAGVQNPRLLSWSRLKTTNTILHSRLLQILGVGFNPLELIGGGFEPPPDRAARLQLSVAIFYQNGIRLRS